MKNEHGNNTQEISHQILAYLMDNPNAQDTLEGIVEWWMLHQDIKQNIVIVRKAVNDLVDRKLLLERKGIDLKKYYLVNRDRHTRNFRNHKQELDSCWSIKASVVLGRFRKVKI